MWNCEILSDVEIIWYKNVKHLPNTFLFKIVKLTDWFFTKFLFWISRKKEEENENGLLTCYRQISENVRIKIKFKLMLHLMNWIRWSDFKIKLWDPHHFHQKSRNNKKREKYFEKSQKNQNNLIYINFNWIVLRWKMILPFFLTHKKIFFVLISIR